MAIPPLPPDPLEWENAPSVDTPLSAEVLNPWGGAVMALASAAREYALDAEQSAAEAVAPTDEVMASAVGTPGSDVRTALDGIYAQAVEDGRPVVRVGDVPVSAAAHGVVGDGVTDDTFAVQAALDAAASAAVYFGPGTYLTGPVYVPDGTRVTGAGPGTVFKRKPETVVNVDSVGVINAHGTSGARFAGVVLEHFTVDANKASIVLDPGADPYDVEGVSFKYVDRLRVSGVTVVDATSEGFDFDDCDDGVVSGSWAQGCGGAGFHFSNGCNRMFAVGCTAVDCGHTSSRGGFDAHSGSVSCRFDGCVTLDCYYGVHLNGVQASAVGCTAENSTANAFRINQTRCVLSGCTGTTVTAGNGVTVTAQGTYATVAGLNISGASQAGIRVLAGAVSTVVTGCVAVSNGITGLWHQADKGVLVGNVGTVSSTGTGSSAANNVAP